MYESGIIAFVGLVLVLTITPGSDTLLTIKNTIHGGQSAGLLTVLGVTCGLLGHVLLAILGLSFILAQNPTLFSLIKLAGALYIIYLGIKSIMGLFHRPDSENDLNNVKFQKSNAILYFQEGLLTNLLNPKVAIFYIAFLPNFIGKDDPIVAKSILLTSIHIVFGFLWLIFLTMSLNKARAWIINGAIQIYLEAIAGIILIALGMNLVVDLS